MNTKDTDELRTPIELVEIPKHIITRISAYQKLGGFNRNVKPPMIVLNALDDITNYDYNTADTTWHELRRSVKRHERWRVSKESEQSLKQKEGES